MVERCGFKDVDELYMREALDEAARARDLGEVPIGAVVVHEGEVIARAHNRRELDEDPSAHAEFSALCAAARKLGRWRLSDCTVYVTLEPCCMCAGLMVNARVARCVYGAADAKGGALGSLYSLNADERLNHAFEVVPGVLGNECAAMLTDFFAELRNGRNEQLAGNAAHVEALAEVERSKVAEGSDESCCSAHGRAARSACGCAASTDSAAIEPVSSPDASAMSADSSFAARFSVPASRRRKVVLAIDSFKGSASSAQVEAWVAEGVYRVEPTADVACVPLADGGEGTAEAFAAALGGTMQEVEVSGPFGGPVRARYLLQREGAGESGRECVGEGTEDDGDVRCECKSDCFGERGGAQEQPGSQADAPATAVIEMAQAAGIDASPCTEEAALAASTRGVGEMLLHAVAQGARRIYVGLGGSATNDGGAGMLQALGARLLNEAGEPIEPGLAGLANVANIDLAPAAEALAGVELTVLSDVTNPLVGARGALAVFGKQKGLPADDAAMLKTYDSWMINYGRLLDAARKELASSDAGCDEVAGRSALACDAHGDNAAEGLASGNTPAIDAGQNAPRPKPKRAFNSVLSVPGAGAAGGLGAALLSLGAELVSGAEALLSAAGFDALAADADLVITGEGNMDEQTAGGKAPACVAARVKRAAKCRCPVVAVVGGRADELTAVYDAGIDLVFPICRKPMPLEQALTKEEARRNLIAAGESAARAAFKLR